MTETEDERLAREARERINARLQPLFQRMYAEMFRAPRYRYWEDRATGHLYAWTTERANGGKFWALEYRPVGPGSRSGKAREWKVTRKVGRKKRKDAKALALGWYLKAVSRFVAEPAGGDGEED